MERLRTSALLFAGTMLLAAAAFGQQFELVYTFSSKTHFPQPDCYGCGGVHAHVPSGGTSPQYRQCHFVDPLPQGAVIQSIGVVRYIATDKRFEWQAYPIVGMDLNGTTLVPPHQVTNFDTSCGETSIKSFESASYPEGFPGYAYGGSNTITTYIADGNAYIGAITLKFRYVLALGAKVVGNPSPRGIVGEKATEPLKIAVIAPAGLSPAGQPIRFEIVNRPFHAKGASLGPEDGTTRTVFTATSQADGTAAANFIFGDKEGIYTVKASVQGSPGPSAEFNLEGRVPAETAVLLNRRRAAPGMIVSLLDLPRLEAAGYDADGSSLGILKADWSVAAKGKGAGSATIEAEPDQRAATLRPQSVGAIVVQANTQLKGPALKANLFLGGAFLDVDPAPPWNIAIPTDDLPKYVPGSNLDGSSVPVPSNVGTPIQTVHLLVANPVERTGFVRFELIERSSWPGISGNSPLKSATTGPDVEFGGASDTDCPYGPGACVTVPLVSGGVSRVPIVVRDFGASCVVRVTITETKKAYPPFEIRIPVDEDGNGLPDGGWYALTNSATGTYSLISTAGLATNFDSDSKPFVAGFPALGVSGDGLTAFEEYRGFVVRGAHRRLNPRHKDLFFWIDPELYAFRDVIRKLRDSFDDPYTLHFLDEGESAATESSNPVLAGIEPVINPNRAGIAGASEQRALRFRWQTAETWWILPTGEARPLWKEFAGLAVPSGSNPDLYESKPEPLDKTPNGTAVLEFYPRHFENYAIAVGASRDSFMNRAGAAVPDCTPSLFLGCDVFSPPYIYPGPDGTLDTVVDPGSDDFYTLFVSDCAPGSPMMDLVPTEVTQMKHMVAGHEVGHGLSLGHSTVCGELMFKGPLEHVPVPLDYSTGERNRFRLHLKH